MNMARSRGLLWALLIAWVAALPARAENFDLYPFANAEEEARFDRLTNELRCPKCQNQSIADSNAPIAQDLRKRTWELVREGRSDEEIVAYLKDRYGEFITYRPSFNVVTALLWTGPFILMGVVAVVVIVRLRRRQAADAATTDETETARRVESILAGFDGSGASGPEKPS